LSVCQIDCLTASSLPGPQHQQQTALTSTSSYPSFSAGYGSADHALSPPTATDYLVYKTDSNTASWSKFQSL